MDEELAREIQILKEKDAIKELRARYCYLIDEGCNNRDHSRLEELVEKYFSRDAVVEFKHIGRFTTHEEIHDFYTKTLPKRLSSCTHTVHNPIIRVDGDRASGKWYFDALVLYKGEKNPAFIKGKYEEQYVKEKGEWKFLSIIASLQPTSPIDTDNQIKNQ